MSRKTTFAQQGANIIKGAGSKGTMKNFPTDQEIEDFQAQLNAESIKSLATAFKNQFTTLKIKINLQQFQKFLNENFSIKPPAESLVHAMFERFKPFRIDGHREKNHVVNEGQMDVLDFVLAMNLLARIIYDKKLKMLFELCDDDEDGCMTPEDILNMMQRVERVFATEVARVELESAVLDNFVADRKAELNFHYIMGMIKSLNLRRNMKLQRQNEKASSNAASNKKRSNDDVNEGAAEDDEDNLITYREFINAIKCLKRLYKTILPRTLSFREVLLTNKDESEFKLSDTHLDDFGMFRYEMNSVFRLHQFKDEKIDGNFFGGQHPLSRTENGKQIKDLDDINKKMEYADVFRPPGLVRLKDQRYYDTNPGNTSALSSHTGNTVGGMMPNQFDNQEKVALGNTNVDQKKEEFILKTQKQIWLTVPSKQLYSRINEESELAVAANAKRFALIEERANNFLLQQQKGQGKDNRPPAPNAKKDEEKKDEKKGDQSKQEVDRQTTMRSEKASIAAKELDKLFRVKIDAVNPNHHNLEEIYKDNLPPETKQLEEYVKKHIENKKSNENDDIDAKIKKGKESLDYIRNRLISEEGRDHKKIMKMWAEQFLAEEKKAEEEKARRQRAERSNQNHA